MELQQVLRGLDSDLTRMILAQLISTGLFLLLKVAMDGGAFAFALVTYRLLAASISAVPVAYFTDRNLATKLSWKAWAWIFISGFFGTAMASLNCYGIRATSASFASNFNNLVPAATFVLSIAIRMEKLELGRRDGRLKFAGATLGLFGALIISLYRGKSLNVAFHKPYHHNSMGTITSRDMTRGSLLLGAYSLSMAAWLIGQAKIYEAYPATSSTVFWMSLASCIQSTIIGIAIDRRKSSWRLGWNLQLVTILYSGVFSTAATCFLLGRTVSRRGPIFPSMFSPLSVIWITILESLFMGGLLYVGSILGMILIIGGLYVFIWGKTYEPKMSNMRGQEQDVRDDASAVELAQSNQAIAESEERREEEGL